MSVRSTTDIQAFRGLIRPSFCTRQFSTGSFISLTPCRQLWPNSNAHRATNMSSKMRLRTRWLVVAAVLAIAQSASVTVQAQFFWNWNQQDQNNRQRSRPQSDGFFDWFGGG